MSSSLATVVAEIKARFKVTGVTEFRGETSLQVDAGQIAQLARYCKEELGFTYLIDLSGIDHMGDDPRFEVVYELYQFARGEYLRLKLRLSEDDPTVATVSDVWATADWHEREAFDMYGIRFAGHPQLERILMWPGYPFHPLRKDFPLAGRASDMPDVAFSKVAPLAGGPFVTVPSTATTKDREPRSREIP